MIFNLCKEPNNFAFVERSGTMKAPVGLLSDRTVLRQQDGGASPRQVRVCGSCGTKKLWSETGLRQWKGRFHRCTVLWHSLCRLNTLAVGNALPQKSSDGCLGIFYLWWMVQDGNCIYFPARFSIAFRRKVCFNKKSHTAIRRSEKVGAGCSKLRS